MFTKPPTSGHPTVVPSRWTLDSSTSLRWGILGPGRIAPRLVRAVRKSMRAELVAVASRDAEQAATFAATHGIPRWSGSYDALLAQT